MLREITEGVMRFADGSTIPVPSAFVVLLSQEPRYRWCVECPNPNGITRYGVLLAPGMTRGLVERCLRYLARNLIKRLSLSGLPFSAAEQAGRIGATAEQVRSWARRYGRRAHCEA